MPLVEKCCLHACVCRWIFYLHLQVEVLVRDLRKTELSFLSLNERNSKANFLTRKTAHLWRNRLDEVTFLSSLFPEEEEEKSLSLTCRILLRSGPLADDQWPPQLRGQSADKRRRFSSYPVLLRWHWPRSWRLLAWSWTFRWDSRICCRWRDSLSNTCGRCWLDRRCKRWPKEMEGFSDVLFWCFLSYCRRSNDWKEEQQARC